MMNLEAVTIQDCLDLYEFMDKITKIENGQVIGFEKESKDKKGWYEGYTDHYIRVEAQGNRGLVGANAQVNLYKMHRDRIIGHIE